MAAEAVAIEEGCVAISCLTSDRLCQAVIVLNFREERLEFDPVEGVVLRDDGLPTVVRYAIDQAEIMKGLVLNGQLEVWNTAESKLLGRCDPHTPVNIDTARTIESLESRQAQLETEFHKRSAVDLP
jgi:hypothetical protein